MSLNDFLKAFYQDESERIHFRAFKPKDAPESEKNRPISLNLTRRELGQRAGELKLRELNHLRGIYFAPNAGGSRDIDICRFNAVFVENDKRTIQEQHSSLDNAPLKPSIRVETRRSVHAYWLLTENCRDSEWRSVQLQLIKFFNGDPSIKNPSRVMRLPWFWHLHYDESVNGKHECKTVTVTDFDPNLRYSIDEIAAAFPMGEAPTGSLIGLTEDTIIKNGNRNNTLFSIAGKLRRQGLATDEIVVVLKTINQSRVRPPLEEVELETIAKNVSRYDSNPQLVNPSAATRTQSNEVTIQVPQLKDAALHGLAGDIVRVIEPHTEADNAALLLQFLAGFGCMIGKGPYFRAEADKHHTKLFVVIVGASSKGRKGTSWGHIRNLLCRVDETFGECLQDGLSSGEGLIYHVRDSQSKKTAIKEKGRIVDYQDEIFDEGAMEKRALVVEPEFARVLRVMQREGNTLSSIMRQAWDSDTLRVMTKNPMKASETHISIIGHITNDELRRNLDETETANGFANRFLWVFSDRSKLLPEGGDLTDACVNEIVCRLSEAAKFAKSIGEVKRDPGARTLWFDIYATLSAGHPGLLGSITSRAEAQVMRLAMLFALLDLSRNIRKEHLDAALAVWGYCEDSARYIFGDQTGDRVTDVVFNALDQNENGLTRTEISNILKRNVTAAQLSASLKGLVSSGRVSVSEEQTNGRRAERFKAMRYELNELNE